jgi:cobalt-zinc-cadmium resistance protein CzcA
LAVSKASIAIEKSKLLPELSVGFSSTTMRGIGANDITYNGLSRFQSAQIGAAIPLFTKAQKEKIKAATMYEGIFVQLYQAQKQELDNQYQSLAMQYVTYLQNVNYYEQEALPNAKTINFIADKQFLNGEINYLEWVMLTNQAIEIQNNYIESVKQLNDILIQINYITPIGIGTK